MREPSLPEGASTMRRLWRKCYVQKEWGKSNRDNLCFWVHTYILISQVSSYPLRFYYCIIAEGKAGLQNYTSTLRKAARVVYKHSLPWMCYWSVTEGKMHIEGRTELDAFTHTLQEDMLFCDICGCLCYCIKKHGRDKGPLNKVFPSQLWEKLCTKINLNLMEQWHIDTVQYHTQSHTVKLVL